MSDLEARVGRFELSLYHGLLVARALLPGAVFAVLVTEALTGGVSDWTSAVWGVSWLWTTGTTPFLWGRLGWARRLPLPARVEVALLVLLVFFGLGARSWHLFHSFVPIVFLGFLGAERAARFVALAVVAALWAAHGVLAVWPTAPLEPAAPALVPSLVVVAVVALVIGVRRVLGDIGEVVAAQKAIADEVLASKRRLVEDDARAAINIQVAARIADLAADVAAGTRALAERTSADVAAFADCVAEIEATVGELNAGLPGRSRRRALEAAPFSLADVITAAVTKTAVLGGTVSVLGGDAADVPLRSSRPAVVQRLVTEALANARKHGDGDVRVTVREGSPPAVIVANRAAERPEPRAGGAGLEAMCADARSAGGTVSWLFDGDLAEVVITLPDDTPPMEPATLVVGDDPDLRAVVERRRGSYERGIMLARVCFAVLAAATIQYGRAEHRSLLPALTASSILVVAWNAALLIRYRRVRELFAEHPWLPWLDGLLVTSLILFEGGMASPWMPLSLGVLMTAGLYLGARGTALLAASFSCAMVGGYGLVHVLRLDDAGTLAQDMPFDWLYNTFIYVAGAAVAAAAGWAFARAADATTAYEAAVEERDRLEALGAYADARADVRRGLHASIQQYVRAALIHLGVLGRAGVSAATFAGIEPPLCEMRDVLDEIAVDLGRPGATAAWALEDAR